MIDSLDFDVLFELADLSACIFSEYCGFSMNVGNVGFPPAVLLVSAPVIYDTNDEFNSKIIQGDHAFSP